MSGLQQGSERPVCLLPAATPVQDDLQPSSEQDPQEESPQLILQHQQRQHNQQPPSTRQQDGRPVKAKEKYRDEDGCVNVQHAVTRTTVWWRFASYKNGHQFYFAVALRLSAVE